MRRPLCVFCAGTLGLELVCAFLPQTGRFVPFAAFFIAGLLWALAGRLRKSPAWGYGICLILGAVLGLVLTGSMQAKWDAIQTAYDGRSVLLEAEVESTTSSYSPGRVRAVLRVETVDREAASLRVECASLPACSPGDRVKGRFALETPDDTARLNALADGIALNAAYEKGFALLGQSTSFRARTARLQKRLSAALRQGMASGPAGVLAAMVTGDRTHLSKELRTAYRGAGLSHVLVVSGMHVSILCGDVLGRLLPNRKKRLRGYTGRRVRALFSAVLALLLVIQLLARPLNVLLSTWGSNLNWRERLLLAIVLAIPLGLLAGAFKHRWLDHLLNLFAYIGISVPIFWFGILLITIFAVQLNWFPSMGMRTIGMEDNGLDLLRHGVLPCIALTFHNLSSYVRYIRSNTISQLSADYVQTQLAYGATRSSILFRHVLKNVLLPVITLFGLSFGELIVGAYVTESVFSWPGMGLLGIQSIASLDYPLIMAIIMLSSMMLIVGNLIADVLYRFADPRIRTLR